MNRPLLYIGLSLLLSFTAKAQPATDSLRHFNEEQLAAYRDNPDFNYTVASEGSSFLAQLWMAFLSWLGRVFFTPTDGVNFYELLLYLLMIGALLFVLLRMFGISKGTLFGAAGKQKGGPRALSEEEDIHALNFEQEFAQAEASSDYHRLIRLYYLAALKLLTDRDLIRWQPGKTNLQYLGELTDSRQRSSLDGLGYYFAYAWYGNFPVEQQHAEKAAQHYQRLQQEVA